MSVLIRGKFGHRPTKRKPCEDTDTDTPGSMPSDGTGRDWSDASTRPATPEVRERQERVLLYRVQDGGPADTSDLDF